MVYNMTIYSLSVEEDQLPQIQKSQSHSVLSTRSRDHFLFIFTILKFLSLRIIDSVLAEDFGRSLMRSETQNCRSYVQVIPI